MEFEIPSTINYDLMADGYTGVEICMASGPVIKKTVCMHAFCDEDDGEEEDIDPDADRAETEALGLSDAKRKKSE